MSLDGILYPVIVEEARLKPGLSPHIKVQLEHSSPTRGAPKAQSDASLEDRILQLTETLYRIDFNGNLPENHSNPSLHNPGEDSSQIVMVAMVIPTHQMESPSTRTSVETTRIQGKVQI